MTDNTPLPQTSRIDWLISAAAIAVAAAPHLFFPPPLLLHLRGELDAFYGISAWAPAMLAGIAFFFGAELGARRPAVERLSAATRGGIVVALLLLNVVALAQVYETQWVGMNGMRPWEQLRVVLPLYAALGAVEVVFWQGFVQQRALESAPRALRVLGASLLPMLVYLPFFSVEDPVIVVPLVGIVLVGYVTKAVAYEIGFSVRACMAVGALIGAMFIWFQQAVLL